jgi:hypothetical protein
VSLFFFLYLTLSLLDDVAIVDRQRLTGGAYLNKNEHTEHCLLEGTHDMDA